MASDIFNVEPPRWLQEITTRPTSDPDPMLPLRVAQVRMGLEAQKLNMANTMVNMNGQMMDLKLKQQQVVDEAADAAQHKELLSTFQTDPTKAIDAMASSNWRSAKGQQTAAGTIRMLSGTLKSIADTKAATRFGLQLNSIVDTHPTLYSRISSDWNGGLPSAELNQLVSDAVSENKTAMEAKIAEAAKAGSRIGTTFGKEGNVERTIISPPPIPKAGAMDPEERELRTQIRGAQTALDSATRARDKWSKTKEVPVQVNKFLGVIDWMRKDTPAHTAPVFDPATYSYQIDAANANYDSAKDLLEQKQSALTEYLKEKANGSTKPDSTVTDLPDFKEGDIIHQGEDVYKFDGEKMIQIK